jgi:hypothetical protein
MASETSIRTAVPSGHVIIEHPMLEMCQEHFFENKSGNKLYESVKEHEKYF